MWSVSFPGGLWAFVAFMSRLTSLDSLCSTLLGGSFYVDPKGPTTFGSYPWGFALMEGGPSSLIGGACLWTIQVRGVEDSKGIGDDPTIACYRRMGLP